MRVLVACFPKSGSTFLTNVIGGLPGFRIAHFVPDYERREQELCDSAISQWDGIHQVAQQHVRQSRHTDRMIKKWDIKTIVLVRNIYDALVSLTDHVAQESSAFPMAWFNESHAAMPFDQRLAAVIELAAPWYFNFYTSWWCSKPNDIVLYEDVVASGRIAHYLVSWGIASSIEDVVAALATIDPAQSRLNVGRPGRGAELMTCEQKEWVAS